MPEKSNRKNAHAQYVKKMRALRPYVNFNYDLRKPFTKYQKTKINQYFREYERLTRDKPYDIQVYRTKNKDRLKKAREFGGNDTRLPGFRVAFIPKTSPEQKIKFSKSGDPYIVSKYVREQFIPIDHDILTVDNIKDYIDDKVKNRPEKVFTVQCGDYELKQSFSRDTIWTEVSRLMHDYSDPETNKFYGNWMRGLVAYTFTNQDKLQDYRDAKRAAQIKKDRARRRKKEKILLFYWYIPHSDSVTITKDNTLPSNDAYEITRREYDNFLETGTL